MVVFAHGSGSSRQSPRNKYVAQILQDAGISTLLIDLLTEEEEHLLQLVAAAQRQKIVKAIVSRGGRPDLAGSASLSRGTSKVIIVTDYYLLETSSATMASVALMV